MYIIYTNRLALVSTQYMCVYYLGPRVISNPWEALCLSINSTFDQLLNYAYRVYSDEQYRYNSSPHREYSRMKEDSHLKKIFNT